MKRALYHHWPFALVAATYTGAMWSAGNWWWWLACAGSVLLLFKWWAWTARREQYALWEAAALAAKTGQRQKLWTAGLPRAHPERLRPLNAAQEDWLAALTAELWPDGDYAVKQDGGQS